MPLEFLSSHDKWKSETRTVIVSRKESPNFVHGTGLICWLRKLFDFAIPFGMIRLYPDILDLELLVHSIEMRSIFAAIIAP